MTKNKTNFNRLQIGTHEIVAFRITQDKSSADPSECISALLSGNYYDLICRKQAIAMHSFDIWNNNDWHARPALFKLVDGVSVFDETTIFKIKAN